MRESITFRPITDADTDFLRRLYASTREDEMKMVPWSDEQKEQFLGMQFYAQTVHYRDHYDTSNFWIIEQGGRAIGRLLLSEMEDELRIVDIALIPEVRGTGVGTTLLREQMDAAAAKGRCVTIHVEHYNPAMRLYKRLGFRHIDTNGVYHLMRWDAEPK